MEEEGILDHENPLDLFALNFVFMPILKRQLDLFNESWAQHYFRTSCDFFTKCITSSSDGHK